MDVELLAEEMWNARMTPALRAGAIDVAISLCPDLGPDVSSEVIRSEPVVALVAASHPLAREPGVPLGSLAGEEFVLFPRELAPRLYDALVGVCRRAGFPPIVRRESFHTAWDLRSLADLPVVALAPRSAASDPPDGVVALALTGPAEHLDTHLVWRTGPTWAWPGGERQHASHQRQGVICPGRVRSRQQPPTRARPRPHQRLMGAMAGVRSGCAGLSAPVDLDQRGVEVDRHRVGRVKAELEVGPIPSPGRAASAARRVTRTKPACKRRRRRGGGHLGQRAKLGSRQPARRSPVSLKASPPQRIDEASDTTMSPVVAPRRRCSRPPAGPASHENPRETWIGTDPPPPFG